MGGYFKWDSGQAEVPPLHASTHASGGTDPVKLDDLAAPDDNTDLNASTAKHGLLPKLPNVATQFLNGVGSWAVPSLPRNLSSPVFSSNFNGNSFSDITTSTQLDLSAEFGLPAGIKWVLLEGRARDSAAVYPTGDLYFACGRSSTFWYEFVIRSLGQDIIAGNGPCLVPCDANGDLWYRINASGTGTMDIWLMVVDYFY